MKIYLQYLIIPNKINDNFLLSYSTNLMFSFPQLSPKCFFTYCSNWGLKKAQTLHLIGEFNYI